MAAKNYYDILGVDKNATRQEIKKAYQRLAKQWHPDVNKTAEAEARFKEAAEAYDVLSHEEKRKAYDEERSRRSRTGAAGAAGAGGEGWQTHSGGSFAGDAGWPGDDWFGMFFGGSGGDPFAEFRDETGGRTRRGGPFADSAADPLEAELAITLEQSFRGEKVRIAAAGKQLDIRIPARARDGTQIRVRGNGANGLPQDRELLITLRYAPHEVYTIEGSDLVCVLQAAPWHLALGSEAEVRLPDGSAVKLKIPAGIQAGKRLRVPGKGLKRGQDEYGDALFTLEIIMPERIGEQEKALYRRLAEAGGVEIGPRKQATRHAAGN